VTGGTEHDAWLREALRHAPDSGAAPPSVVSAAILAEARAAAARPTTPSGVRRTAASANPLLVFWAWLARPAVAAGFASVMAATLVGLMWWDRPMDETLPRTPALERNEATRAPAAAAPTAPAAPAAPAATTTTAKPAPRDTAAAATAPAPELAQARREAKVADAADTSRAKDAPAKERMEARKSATPAAFPSGEGERERADLAPARAPVEDAKKEAATPTPATTPAPFAAQQAAPRAAPAAAPAPAPAPSGRLGAEEARNTASSRGVSAAAAKSVAPRSAVAEARPNEADAFAPSGAAAQSEPPARLRQEGAAMTASPLAPLLAALSGESSRASRQAAGGAAIAVEPSWRDWLIDVEVASAGRWRRAADVREQATADADRPLPATLRLAIDGRPAAIVRIDGTTAHLEMLGASPARWQATLAPSDAERLRATLARLPP
jgi:hypothetical protein